MEYGDFPRERARYDGEGMVITLIIILIIIKTIIVVSIVLKFTVAMPSLDRSFLPYIYFIPTLVPKWLYWSKNGNRKAEPEWLRT